MKRLIFISLLIIFSCLAYGENRGSGQSSQRTPAPSPTVALGSLEPSPSPSSLNDAERFEYDKLRLQRDLQKELLDWAQTRFWIFAILTFLIGFFGVRALVREMISSELKGATRAAAQAEAAADHTREVTKDVRADADKYRETVAQLSETATRVDDRFKELDSRISAEGAHAVASSELQLDQLAKRVDELSEVMRTVALESRQSQEALRNYEARIAELNSEAANQNASFSNNSKYSIVVVTQPAVPESRRFGGALVKLLARNGYRTSTGSWSNLRSSPQFQSIDIHYKSGNRDEFSKRLAKIVRKLAADSKLDVTVKLQEGPDVTVTTNDAVIFC